MEVGAVKQAFNNEIILLKNNLNQAKTQTIHKLIRKAKTLAEKESPEHLKEKLKRKAESAVKEVLIIKKIKPREIARFIVTHTGKLNDFLNKPTLDNDKACARLLLHKALQDKYKLIREKFSNMSIKDLFMSRQERLKLKKEAKEQQKNKKKARESKNSQTNVEGEWDVEMIDTSKEIVSNDTTNNEISDNDNEVYDSVIGNNDIDSEDIESGKENNDDDESDESNEIEHKKNNTTIDNEKFDSGESDSKEIEQIIIATKNNVVKNKVLKAEKKTKKHKEKNKNLNEKMQTRKFNNKSEEVSTNAIKIVDPFFKTSTGENYMSLVEPRQPDEVKEVHKEGNRKYRRAVMFGHVPKIKPQKRNFEPKKEKKQDDVINNKKNRSNQNSFKEEVSREVPEKLHPSWEAKKKQSTILPFKGKKIVFDES